MKTRLRGIAFTAMLAGALSSCSLFTEADCVDVEGQPDPAAPGYIVMYHQGVPAGPATARLAAKYDFTPMAVYDAVGGFAAELSPRAVAGIRCEPEVRSMGHNGMGRGG